MKRRSAPRPSPVMNKATTSRRTTVKPRPPLPPAQRRTALHQPLCRAAPDRLAPPRSTSSPPAPPSSCPALCFIDCALAHQRSVDSEEVTLCCTPSVRSSVTAGEHVALLLSRSDLPDDQYEIVIACITDKHDDHCTAAVVDRREGMTEEQEVEWGQEGMEPTVSAGEVVQCEVRHIAWLVKMDDERRGQESGRRDEKRRKRLEEYKAENGAAEKEAAAGFVLASSLKIDEAQYGEEEKQMANNINASGSVSGREGEQDGCADDSFTYVL